MKDFIIEEIAKELQVSLRQVKTTLGLLEQGNTIPFITRYRQEATGGLNEQQIQEIRDKGEYFHNLQTRKEEILQRIREQGKLTAQLEKQIQSATQMKRLEDLYLPFRPKRRTRATIAKEQGLEPLAELILQQSDHQQPAKEAAKFINPEQKLNDVEAVWQGAMDIVAERVSEDLEVRERIRELTRKQAQLVSSKIASADDPNGIFKDYYDFAEAVSKVPPHRILALDRGEKEKVLRLKIDLPSEKALDKIERVFVRGRSPWQEYLQKAIADGYKRLLAPAIAREIRSELTQKAHEHAISVFAENLRNLLMISPMRDMRILAIDPGYVSGCKLAALSENGDLLDYGVIYPHATHKDKPAPAKQQKAKQTVLDFLNKHNLQAIAIGNGTACRETELFISELIEENKLSVVYAIVNEAGASVYSASEAARQEFPELEASFRGTVSIGRRLLDPLAELVKIDPKSLGVGLYQHDINSKQLEKALHRVVESCVNFVGANINRASPELLSYISGINKRTAQNIVAKRRQWGKFPSREAIKKVPGIGEETFTQCAGFLRIPGSENILDQTAIHPESYGVCQALLQQVGVSQESLQTGKSLPLLQQQLGQINVSQMAHQLTVGEPTLRDIISNLLKPGRDPREELPAPVFRKGVLTIDDLEEGMVLDGVVRNVVDFGAFVDIGIKNNGLVHISQMDAHSYVRHPSEVCKVGDQIKVQVISLDYDRERVGLTMILT